MALTDKVEEVIKSVQMHGLAKTRQIYGKLIDSLTYTGILEKERLNEIDRAYQARQVHKPITLEEFALAVEAALDRFAKEYGLTRKLDQILDKVDLPAPIRKSRKLSVGDIPSGDIAINGKKVSNVNSEGEIDFDPWHGNGVDPNSI